MSVIKLPSKVSFGKAEASSTDNVAAIKTIVAAGLMDSGLPGSLSLNIGALGLSAPNGEPITGEIILKPTISKKDGRVMYNSTGTVVIGGVTVKPMGNWLLPKNGFTVDHETHQAYVSATQERDNMRKARAARVALTPEQLRQAEQDALEAGESTD